MSIEGPQENRSEKLSPEEVKEQIFGSIMASILIKVITDGMSECDFSDEEIEEFEEILVERNESQIRAVLALPESSRKKHLTTLKGRLENGNLDSMEALVDQLVTEADESGTKLGYFLGSDENVIPEDEEGRAIRKVGSGKFDRVANVICSTDLTGLVRGQDVKGKEIFFVRVMTKGAGAAQPGQMSGSYVAPFFSVIESAEADRTLATVEEEYQKQLAKNS